MRGSNNSTERNKAGNLLSKKNLIKLKLGKKN